MRKKVKEYALYKDDEFIDLGTVDHLAKRLNVKENTIRFYSYPTYQKRTKGHGYILIEIK